MNQKEAFVYWHRAAGYSYEQICRKLKCSEKHARSLYYRAVVKSRRAGVSYLLERGKGTQNLAKSNSAGISEFIVNKKVTKNKFDELKKLAAEAADELAKIKKM
jgi:hypothetical protein